MYVDVYLGRRGMGKTSLLAEQAAQAQDEGVHAILVQSARHIGCRNPGVQKTWSFDAATRYAWENRPAAIFVDEYTAFHGNENFHDILHYGRNWNIALILNSQRPADVPPDIRSVTNRFFIFQLTEDTDLTWVKKNLGREYAERAKRLNYFEYLVYPESEDDVRRVDSRDRQVHDAGGGEKDQAGPGDSDRQLARHRARSQAEHKAISENPEERDHHGKDDGDEGFLK